MIRSILGIHQSERTLVRVEDPIILVVHEVLEAIISGYIVPIKGRHPVLAILGIGVLVRYFHCRSMFIG